MMFQQIRDSDYDYSDSEDDGAVQIQNGQNEGRILMDLLMAKHREFGSGYYEAGDFRIRMCPYCLSVAWTSEHCKECLFIPTCIQ